MRADFERRLVEHELEMISDAELVAWATRMLEYSETAVSDQDIVELASLATAQPRLCEPAGLLLERAVRRNRPDFDVRSAMGRTHARAGFIALCQRLVTGDTTPTAFCRAVARIAEALDVPVWLADFPEECQRCSPDSREDVEHLAAYAAGYLAVAAESAGRVASSD